MTQFQRAIISGEFRADTEDASWPDAVAVAALLRAVEASGLWLQFGYWGRSGDRKPSPVTSLDALIETIPTWRERASYTVGPDASGSRDASYFEITKRQGLIAPVLVVAGADLQTRASSLLHDAESLIVAWNAALRGRAQLQLRAGVTPDPGWEPDARPPRALDLWSTSALLDVVSVEAPVQAKRNGDDATSAGFAQALQAPMPTGTERVERDDVIVFRWMADLRDDATVRRALGIRYDWLVKALNAPPERGWNAAGDKQISLGSTAAHPPLVRYDAQRRIGYLPIVATDDGDVDEEVLGRAAEWVRAGKLPDGTPLAELRLVAPVREAALALRPRARALGMPTVLYVTSDGAFWNPAAEERSG